MPKKSQLLTISIFCAVSLTVSAPVFGYFLPSAYGVRPAGMGEAFVSLADDANAILYNPAGLGQLEQIEFTSMYSDLFSNVHARLNDFSYARFGHQFAAFTLPVDVTQGSFGLSWLQFDSAYYKENTVNLGYGRKLITPNMWGLGMELDFGVTVKYLQWAVAQNTYTEIMTRRDKSGATADLGLLLKISPEFSFGFSAENVLPADLGVLLPEIVPIIWRGGITYSQAPDIAWFDSYHVTLEVDQRDDFSNATHGLKAGLETWWLDRLIALRLGLNNEAFTSGFSFQYPMIKTPTQLLQLQADYAFSYPFTLVDTLGSHRLGFSLHWDLQSPPVIVQPPAALAFEENSVARQLGNTVETVTSAQTAIKTSEAALKTAHIAADEAKKIHDESYTEESADIFERVSRHTKAANEAMQAAETAYQIAKSAEAEAIQTVETMQTMVNANSATSYADILPSAEKASQAVQKALAISAVTTEKSNAAIQFAKLAQQEKYAVGEANQNSIVIGIEDKIYKDFGEPEKIPALKALFIKYLQKKSSLKVDVRTYRFDELKYAFRQGEIDLLVSYNNYFNTFYRQGVLKPVLTLEKKGMDQQHYFLLVLESSPIQSLNDLKRKRLGYPAAELLNELPRYFGVTDASFSFKDKYDTSIDGLAALQIDMVDAIMAAEFIFDIQQLLHPHMPKKLKIIATSPPVPNRPVYIKKSKSEMKNQQMQALLSAAKTMHLDPAAKPIFQFFHFDAFTSFDEFKYRNAFIGQ